MRLERIRARVVWYHAHVAQLHIMVDAQERATSLWGDTTFSMRKNDGQLLWTSFSRNKCLLKETTWKKIMLSQVVLLGYCNMWLLQFSITEYTSQITFTAFFWRKTLAHKVREKQYQKWIRDSNRICVGSNFISILQEPGVGECLWWW